MKCPLCEWQTKQLSLKKRIVRQKWLDHLIANHPAAVSVRNAMKLGKRWVAMSGNAPTMSTVYLCACGFSSESLDAVVDHLRTWPLDKLPWHFATHLILRSATR